MGVSLHDPERHTHLLRFVEENEIPFVPVHLLVDAEVQYVKRSYTRVSAETVDMLDTEERSLCIAIEGSDDVAMPRQGMLYPEVRALLKSACLTIRLVDETTVEVKLGSEKTVFTPENEDTVKDLFVEGPLSVPPVYNPQKRLGPREALMGKLPYRLTECISELLQDHYRMHVLCTAAVSDPRPVVLDRAELFQLRQDNNEKGWKTFVNATFHSSSASCLCPAHNKPRRTGKVRLSIQFCGRILENGVCPTHPLRENQCDYVCTAHLGMSILCKHAESPDGVKITLPVTGTAAYQAISLISEVAVVVVLDPSNEGVVMPLVEDALEEAQDELRRTPKSIANEKHDLQALHLLRSHSAIRKANRRLGRVHGQTESWLTDLSFNYGSLFPAHVTS